MDVLVVLRHDEHVGETIDGVQKTHESY